MSAVTVGIVCLIVFLLFLVLGVHVALDMIIISFAGTVFLRGVGPAISLLGQTSYYSIASPSFASLPLFVLMGAFAAAGGYATSAYKGLHKATRGVPGALAVATCLSCAFFGAVSGSSLATAAVFGKLALPEMAKYNYKRSFSMGCIACAGCFAAMIPPSSLFIIYAIFTNQSVGKLFMAGVIPGIFSALVFSTGIIFMVKRNPSLAPMTDEDKIPMKLRKRLSALKDTWQISLVAVIVLGGIYTGIFTPTEAGAAGAVVTLLGGILAGGIRTWSNVMKSLKETAKTTAMVFIIIVGALYFSRFLAMTQIPAKLSAWVIGSQIPGWAVISFILLVWFLLGMIIIPAGIFALTLPIFFPIISALGYDPIWFGVIAVHLSEIAAVTPPVGLNVFTLKGVAPEVPIEEIFSGIWPFVFMNVVILIILLAFPGISTFLPSLM